MSDKPLSTEEIEMISRLKHDDRNFGAGLRNICISHELMRAHVQRLSDRIEKLREGLTEACVCADTAYECNPCKYLEADESSK